MWTTFGESGSQRESRTGGRAKPGVRSVTARQIVRPRLVRLVCIAEGRVDEDGNSRSSEVGAPRYLHLAVSLVSRKAKGRCVEVRG
jgi:hypothetical protein